MAYSEMRATVGEEGNIRSPWRYDVARRLRARSAVYDGHRSRTMPDARPLSYV
jgi:hypothetical protein